MAIFDAERFVDNVQSIVQTNLGAKLTAITADFASEDAAAGRTITLEDVPSTGYFLNTVTPSPNVNPFIAIIIDSVAASSAGATPRLEYNFSIVLGHFGLKNQTWDNITRKMFRYVRAIKEVMLENFDKNLGHSKTTLVNIIFNQEFEVKEGQVIRANGLTFSATIA